MRLRLSRARSRHVSLAFRSRAPLVRLLRRSSRASSQQRCAFCGVGMRAGVRCGAARPAPTQLRGTARGLLPPLRAACASRVAQGVARGTRLDQGCVARLVASVAAGGEPPRGRGRPPKMVDAEAEQAEPLARRRRAGNAGERVAGEPARREPPKRERRSPNTGKQGEKTGTAGRSRTSARWRIWCSAAGSSRRRRWWRC